MALPTRGLPDWDDELNGHINTLDASVQAATSKANVAASDAAYARNRADEVHTAVIGTADDATAGFVNDAASSTRAALSAKYAAKNAIVHRVVDYATPQAAIDAAPTGSTVLFPPGNTVVTTPLAVSKSLTILGHTMLGTRIVASGCNGVEVSAGVSDFRLVGIEVAAEIRHTTTANTYVGVKVNGTTGSRPANHVYRDVYVDGFHTAFQTRYLWSSVFDNARSDYGSIGIDAYGLSVNNFVTNSSLNVTIGANSRGIRLNGKESPTDATAVASEGWIITGNLIYGGGIGVEMIGVTHCNVSDNIVDFCSGYGVLIQGNGTHFGGNSKIAGNYIAMTGANGSAGIALGNSITNAQNVGNRVVDNHVIVYSGSTCSYGINVTHSNAFANIRGNVIRGFATTDINLGATAGSTVIGNRCLDTPGAGGNIYAEGVNHIGGNDGTVYLVGGNPNVYAVDALGKKVWIGLQAHTAGTHAWGDRVVHARPAVGSPKGWVCTAAGTPGTWVADGYVSPLGTSTTTNLAAIGNAINTADKYAGKTVYNTTTKKLVTADGATAGSVWVDATGTTAHTPV